MTSAGVASVSFQSFSMADDSMEISSEHGGFDANDDIDIDIDFTAGQADEDYMIEDVGSDVEFKDDDPLTNDDMMEDDFIPSIPGGEIHHDDDEQFQDIPEETLDEQDVEESNNVPVESDDTKRRVSNHAAEVPIPDVPAQSQGGAIEIASTDVTEALNHVESPHAVVGIETTKSTAHPSPKIQSSFPDGTNTDLHSTDNSVNQTNTNSPGEKETSTEEAEVVDTIDDNGQHLVEAVDASDAAVEGEVEEYVNEEQTHTIDMESTYAGIIVTYQDTQYALFSSFDDEDSDSFFLKDRSITQEPISSFLNALRAILQAELNDDDELCIGIDVLRLEFGERSAEIDKVTFQDLITLHQRLVRNDGIDSPEPLHFTLGTRPEFAKRFAGLLEAASEGKGLSELIPSDEESESYDDMEPSIHIEEEYDPDQSENHGDFQDEYTPQNDENAVPPSLGHPEDRVEDGATFEVWDFPSVVQESDGQVHDHSAEATTEGEEYNLEDSTNATNPATTGETGDDTVPEPQEVHLEQESEAVHGADEEQQNEDGDLIDYGDEEVDSTKPTAPRPNSGNGNNRASVTPCIKPDVCFCPACNEILLAKVEAMNEHLRRRSDSRAAAEEAFATNDADETTNTSNAAEHAKPQKLVDDADNEDEIDFDFDDEQTEHVNAASHESHEEEEHVEAANEFYEEKEEHVEAATHDSPEKHNGGSPSTRDDSGKTDGYYTGFDDQEGAYDQTYDFEDEIEVANDIEGKGHDIPAQSEKLTVVTSMVGEVASLKSNDTSPEVSAESVTVSADTVDADEIDYDDDDLPTTTVEKSTASVASDHHQPHDSRKEDEIDEIDYDDDDDEIIMPQSPKAAALPPSSNSPPGKRQRSESLSEVAPGGESQEAKRIRS